MSEGADTERGLFPQSAGEQLAAERVLQKLELSDVAARTRIPLRHLEAIETGKHDALPAIPYSAGFVKSYGNMLGMDGQALSLQFREELGDARRAYFEPTAYEPVDPSRVPSRLLAMIALGVALLLGMAYLLLRFEGDNSDLAKLAADTPEDIRPIAPKPAATLPAPAVAPAPAGLAAPTGPISIVATGDAWMKISERDGSQTYFMNVLKGGDTFTLPETAVDPILRTSRAQDIKVQIGGTALPPVAQPDTLVRAYSLKREALIAIATAKQGTAGEVPAAVGSADVPAATASETQTAPQRHRPRRAPPGDDPTGSRPNSTGPVTDSDQRPPT